MSDFCDDFDDEDFDGDTEQELDFEYRRGRDDDFIIGDADEYDD